MPHGSDRMARDRAVLAGNPCIRGMRISGRFVLEPAASGAPRDDIVRAYPHLTGDEVQHALLFAMANLCTDVAMAAEAVR